MIIEHIAIFTSDTERLKKFYEKYFNAVAGEKYYNLETRLKTYFLTFESGARLEIMQRPDIDAIRPQNCKGLNHIAFKTGSKVNVDNLYKKLTEDGYTAKSPPRITGDGYYEGCIYDPDYNEIEISE